MKPAHKIMNARPLAKRCDRTPSAGVRVFLFSLALLVTFLSFPCNANEAPSQELMRAVMPAAQSFGPFEGEPSAATAYSGGLEIGYVFTSWMTVRSSGYSSKPLNLLVGLDLKGIITGVRILEQHEPLLVIGIEDKSLDDFVNQFEGLDIRDPIHLSREKNLSKNTIAAVSRATISSLIIQDAVLRSARRIAGSRGLIKSKAARLDLESFEPLSWDQLMAEGAIAVDRITVGEAMAAFQGQDASPFPSAMPIPAEDENFIKLYTALATPARIGRNLLGERDFRALSSKLALGDQILFIAAEGFTSFKGRAYRKTGTFERIHLLQKSRSIEFQSDGYLGRERLEVPGAPDLREIGFFILRANSGFNPALPFRLQFTASARNRGGKPAFATFEFPYSLPSRYLLASSEDKAGEEDAPLWQRHWRERSLDIAIMATGLLVLSVILFFQDALAKRRKLYLRVRIGFLIFTLIWIGWTVGAQLSVLNVLTFADSLIHGFRWDFFLLEPLIFILWSFTAVAMLFWGRGVFCGWLCPFGALQELLARLSRFARIPEWRLPFPLHERLWPIKYVTFIALFALFLYDPAIAISGAEVEPFKTAIVLGFDRSWPFLLYAGGLLLASLFVTRFFCRYLCPLGAALALPARLRMFEWLRRRWQCGKPCQTCAQSCPVQAIHPEGKINPNECIHCLNCQVNYYADDICPVLVERKKRQIRARAKPEAEPA